MTFSYWRGIGIASGALRWRRASGAAVLGTWRAGGVWTFLGGVGRLWAGCCCKERNNASSNLSLGKNGHLRKGREMVVGGFGFLVLPGGGSVSSCLHLVSA